MKKKIRLTDNYIYIILLITALLVNIKMLFFGYCTDSAYCVVMGYRMNLGDRLFVEMWEPHQMSVIIPFLLVKLFLQLFGSMEGIVVWMHIWGFVFFALTAFAIIKLLKPYVSMKTLHYMAFLFMVIRPKYTNMPDYANMSVVFSTLFCLLLIKAVADKKPIYTCVAGILLCCAVLAYPSNALLLPVGIALLFALSKQKIKDIAMLTATCIAGGCVFITGVCISSRLGLTDLISGAKKIFLSDSHSSYRYSGWIYYRVFVYGVLFLLITAAIAWIAGKILHKTKDVGYTSIWGLCLLSATPLATIIFMKYALIIDRSLEWYNFYPIIFLTPIVAGIVKLSKDEIAHEAKLVFIISFVVAITVFTAALMLTNLSLITAVAYMSLAVVGGIVPACETTERKQSGYIFALCLFLAISVNQLFIASDASGAINNITDEEKYVSVGPEKWQGTTRAYCDRIRIGMSEWHENITSEDSVLLADVNDYELIAYTYTDAKTANYSVTSTPSYDEALKNYWEEFPQKKPTVIAIPCYEGTENRDFPQWLSEYIDEHYEINYSGTFWNFYK